VTEGDEVSLIEGWTPLLAIEPGVWIKDEARNPTGSFKARGMTAAVSVARILGAKAFSAPSAGNAAGALAAYGAAARLPVIVAMPDDTPRPFIDECRHYGAAVHLVPGSIADAGKWLGGALPDVVVYPTGGGTGLVGMWKAWDEMQELGWIGPERPRLVSVQPEGCAPVVKAFASGAETTEAWPGPITAAYGLRVPSPIGGFICLRALRATRGTAIAVAESEIEEGTRSLAARTGIDICPEGGAAWAALLRLRASGWIAPGERVVVFNTGPGLKYR
jgi:threonine synthase